MRKITIRAQKDFSERDIKAKLKEAKNSDSEEDRRKASRLAAEMMAYNLRSIRGDFDTY